MTFGFEISKPQKEINVLMEIKEQIWNHDYLKYLVAVFIKDSLGV